MSEMKKKLQRKGARKGFTLVELLIVIIIIGILAGGMMLVAGTSRDSAEASRIISDLRNMKAAALMWMADNPTTVTADQWAELGDNPEPINRYIDRPLIADEHPFIFASVSWKATGTGDDAIPAGEVWLLGYDLTEVRAGVKSKLEDQASSAGLFQIADISESDYIPEGNPVVLDDDEDFYKSDENYVFVVVQ
jgi:prepilin-type N-terminal cleavage/methylation domain-containing protein